MRVSLNWLRELVALPAELTVEQLAERLTLAGFEVEAIEDRRTWAAGVVVGRVLSRQPHPQADKLSVCQVDVGQGGTPDDCVWSGQCAGGGVGAGGAGGDVFTLY